MRYAILRDGIEVGEAETYLEAIAWLHRHTSGSADWAMKYEGYEIVERAPA